MMAKQNEKQPITSTKQQDDGAVLSTSRSEDAIVLTTSSVQGTPAAPQQDAVVPLGTPQYTTPASMRPQDKKYVMPHMVKLHVLEQCSQQNWHLSSRYYLGGYLVMKQSVSVKNTWLRRRD